MNPGDIRVRQHYNAEWPFTWVVLSRTLKDNHIYLAVKTARSGLDGRSEHVHYLP